MQGRIANGLFPFDRGRRFAGDVVHHPRHSAHFIDDAARDQIQQFIGQRRPPGGHKIGGFHDPQGNDLFILTPYDLKNGRRPGKRPRLNNPCGRIY